MRKKKLEKAANLFLRGGIWIWRAKINGKRVKRSTGFKEYDVVGAQAKAAEFEAEQKRIAAGWIPDPKEQDKKRVPTFAAWASRYQKAYSARKRRPERDAQMLKHALPYFGQKRMNDVTKEDCETYLANRGQKQERKEDDGTIARIPAAQAWTIKRERGFLCRVWNAAIEDKKTTNVSDNPWRDVKPPKVHPRTRTIDVDEQTRMMAAANPEYRRALVVLFGSGLRSNEFLQLRLRDIKSGEIHVRWQTSKGEKERKVPLLPEVAQAIKEQAAAFNRSPFERLWPKTDWALLKTFKKIAKRAGVDEWESLRVHDTRRSYATRLAEAAVPLKRLSAILGHSSPTVTAQYYTHIDERDNARAVAPVAHVLALSGTPVAPQKNATA